MLSILSLLGVGSSLFLKNSLSTLLTLTNIQIMFFGLSSIQQLHSTTLSLTYLKPVLGYNDDSLFEKYNNNPEL